MTWRRLRLWRFASRSISERSWRLSLTNRARSGRRGRWFKSSRPDIISRCESRTYAGFILDHFRPFSSLTPFFDPLHLIQNRIEGQAFSVRPPVGFCFTKPGVADSNPACPLQGPCVRRCLSAVVTARLVIDVDASNGPKRKTISVSRKPTCSTSVTSGPDCAKKPPIWRGDLPALEPRATC